jgi:DNA-binding transcriptional MerR regulator
MDYSIRDLADRFGVTLRALRFYEGKGLLSPVRKAGSTSARRTYSENDAFRIAEIQRGARFGLSLREIKQYLVDGPTGPWLDIPTGGRYSGRRNALRGNRRPGRRSSRELNENAAGRPLARFPGKPLRSRLRGSQNEPLQAPAKMPRLLRPHIPVETRCRVVLRQLGEMWPTT